MPDTLRVTVESAHYDYNNSTTVDTQMHRMDEAHRQHVARRLRECFSELWGHEVIVTFPEDTDGATFCAACGTAIKDAHSRYMTNGGPVHEWCHKKRVA
jgi:hypothetical protein